MKHLEIRNKLGCWSLWEVHEHGKFQLTGNPRVLRNNKGVNGGRIVDRVYKKLSWSSEEKAREFAAKKFPGVAIVEHHA